MNLEHQHDAGANQPHSEWLVQL